MINHASHRQPQVAIRRSSRNWLRVVPVGKSHQNTQLSGAAVEMSEKNSVPATNGDKHTTE